MAQELPALSYFANTYQVVGQVADGLFTDQVILTADDAVLRLSSCQQGEGWLRLDTGGEGRFMFGEFQGVKLICEWFNTYDNYPLIACQASGVAMTFWPKPEAEGAGLECPP